MDYTPLLILQQRLNALESNYGDQYSNDDQIIEPRIARVAPMSPTPESIRGRLPPINYQAVATIDISALHLPNPTAASFSNAAAATAAPAHVATARSAVCVAAHSATHTTPSSYTATYAAPPLNYNTTVPSLYCIASTSGNSYYGPASASNSDTDSSATNIDTVSASGHDYATIPPFVRRALYSHDSTAATVAIRRSAPDEGDDEHNMDEGTVPRKTAKRSSEHMTAVDSTVGENIGGDGTVGGNISGVDGNVSGGGYVGFVSGYGSGGGYGNGNGSGVDGNGSDVVGNGGDVVGNVGGNGKDDLMDCGQ